MAKKRKRSDAPTAIQAIQEDHEWRTRSAFDTLVRAQEVMADKGLMRQVRRHAQKESERARRVSRLDGKEI